VPPDQHTHPHRDAPLRRPPTPQVAEQQSLVARIDENVDETLANVDSAKAQLLKYLNSISGNRWLALKVFGVLIVFLCIFIFLL
jgi:syntaxin 5